MVTFPPPLSFTCSKGRSLHISALLNCDTLLIARVFCCPLVMRFARLAQTLPTSAPLRCLPYPVHSLCVCLILWILVPTFRIFSLCMFRAVQTIMLSISSVNLMPHEFFMPAHRARPSTSHRALWCPSPTRCSSATLRSTDPRCMPTRVPLSRSLPAPLTATGRGERRL